MGTERVKLNQVRLKTPVQHEDLAKLKIGDVVYLDGVIYTGREGVYKRLVEDGEPAPFDWESIGNVNFHCSPAIAEGENGEYRVGAVTATASFRFSKWLDQWFKMSGAKILIGKGGMTSKDYRELFVPNGAIYLTTVGYGTGALLGRGVKRVREVHWLKEHGIAQAMWVFEIENLGPFMVESDLEGNSLFERSNEEVSKNYEKLYEGSRPAILRRYGETDERSDEVI